MPFLIAAKPASRRYTKACAAFAVDANLQIRWFSTRLRSVAMNAATEVVPSVLRLCRVANGDAVRDDHGTTLAAKWDPSCGHRLVTLFSSGVLRVWDVVLNECVDLALHLPGAPVSGSRGPTPAKRSAIGIAMFDFLPPVAGSAGPGAGPSIVFCTRRSRAVYTAQLPGDDGESSAAAGDSADFLAGIRVFEYSTRLASDPCCVAAWTVAFSACGVYVAAVGCADGSVEAWAGSTGLNPENVTGARTMRDASPAVVRARAFTPRAATHVDPRSIPASAAVAVPASAVRAHTGRVTRLCPIPACEAWAGDGGASLFVSTSSDGSAQLWRVAVLASPSGRAPSVIPGDIVGVVVEPLFALPSDGALISAVTAVAWPLRHSSTGDVGRTLVSSLRWPQPSGLATAPSGAARALLATGSADGAISMYECVFSASIGVGATAEESRPPLPTLRVIGTVAPQPAEPITALALSPPMSQGVAEDSTSPAGMVGDAGCFVLAVADASGLLRVYRLEGTGAPSSAATSPAAADAWGAAPPVLAVLRGTATPSSGDDAESPSPYDAVLGIGAEAALLERLRAMEVGSRSASDSRSAAHGASTTVTAVALQGLRRCVVACGFHDVARGAAQSSSVHRRLPQAPSAITVGALMAVSGGGEVSLWARGALPGDSPPAEPLQEPTLIEMANGVEEPSPLCDSTAIGNETREPANSARCVGPSMTEEIAAGDGDDDEDEPPRPQALPSELEAGLRAWLEQQQQQQASVTLQTADAPPLIEDGVATAPGFAIQQDAANQRPTAILRVLQPTESSDHRNTETAAEQLERTRQHRPRAHSPGGPAALIDLHALRLSAADAVRSLYQKNSGGDARPEHLRSRSGRHACLPGGGGTALSQYPGNTALQGAAISPVATVVPAPGVERGTTSDGQFEPASEPLRPGADGVLARVAAKTSGPYMEPAFRNPARVAAVLLESSGLLDSRPDDGGDGAAFGRLAAAATDDSAHHLVAPVLGSAAAIQAEVARLEALRFDTESAARAVLRERGVADSVVVESVLKRCRLRQSGSDERTDGSFSANPDVAAPAPLPPPVHGENAAVPASPVCSPGASDPSGISSSGSGENRIDALTACPPLLISAGTTSSAPSPAVARLLARPRRSGAVRERASVSVGDVLHWQFHLRPGGADSTSQRGGRTSSRPGRPALAVVASTLQPAVAAAAAPPATVSPRVAPPALINFTPVVRQARLPAASFAVA